MRSRRGQRPVGRRHDQHYLILSYLIFIIIILIIILITIIISIIIIINIIIVVIVCKGILDKRSYTYEDVQDKANGPIVTGQSTLTYMFSKNVTST